MNTAVEDPSPLRAATTLVLDRPSGPTEATIDQVVQRNWSRTARAVTDGSTRLFVKQFVGRDRRWHTRVYLDEAAGAALLGAQISSLDVAPVVARSDARLVLAYPEYAIDTADELLRDAPDRFAEAWPRLRDDLRVLLEDLVSAAPRSTHLPRKERGYASRGDAVVVKGLDVRNLGLRRDGGKTLVFDVGRPYLGPVEEVAARLFVTVALLNWGRPTSRFVSGPPFDLVADAQSVLAPWLLRDAVRRHLATEMRGRRQWPAGQTSIERAGRRAVIESAGRVYRRRLERWFDRNGL